jgi:hypothetical protein
MFAKDDNIDENLHCNSRPFGAEVRTPSNGNGLIIGRQGNRDSNPIALFSVLVPGLDKPITVPGDKLNPANGRVTKTALRDEQLRLGLKDLEHFLTHSKSEHPYTFISDAEMLGMIQQNLAELTECARKSSGDQRERERMPRLLQKLARTAIIAYVDKANSN